MKQHKLILVIALGLIAACTTIPNRVSRSEELEKPPLVSDSVRDAAVEPEPLPVEMKRSLASETQKADPARVTAKVRSETDALKDEKSPNARVKRLEALEKYLEAESEKADDIVGAQFSVALEPLFSRKKDIASAASCQDMKSLIVFKFAGGSGFDGQLPEFVHDSLALLAAACQNPALRDPGLTP